MLGDSKTQHSSNTWPHTLARAVEARDGGSWSELNGGIGGTTVDRYLPFLPGVLAAWPADDPAGGYRAVLLNWGVNDFSDPPVSEAAWEINYLSIIDAVHAKMPSAKVYLMRPWKRGFDADAATYHGWIATIVAARAFTYLGPDEAVWLKGSDNGATMTSDGIHYSDAGEAECVRQWLAATGY